MGWLSRLFGRGTPPTVTIASLAADPPSARVAVEGRVEIVEPVLCPLSGDPAVIVEYEARAPGFAARAYGLREQGAVRLVSELVQAADFVLTDGTGRAVIRVDRGSDVNRIHAELSARHGIELSARTRLIRPGERVRVFGRVQGATGSPHRRPADDLFVDADEIEPLDAADHASR
jgi:hypothetical protein